MKPDNWDELNPNQRMKRRRSRQRWLARIREAERINRQKDMDRVYAACLRAREDGLRKRLGDDLATQEPPGTGIPEGPVPTADPSATGIDSGCSAKSA
jgi:hypothetical protein